MQGSTGEDIISMAGSAEDSEPECWLIDSGALRHMTNYKNQSSD